MTWLTASSWFFQSPWLLLSLLTALVPIFIHLFSKSKGKVIPFGNLGLINNLKPVNLNEIRLIKRLLLLSRLLLLLFCVLLISQLYFDDRASNHVNSEGNILVTKDWLNSANTTELTALANKAQKGVVVLLSTPSKRLSSEDISSWLASETMPTETIQMPQNTWLLVKQYANTLPSNSKITVYSTNRLSQFAGNKVYVPNSVIWKIKPIVSNAENYSKTLLTNVAIAALVLSDHDRQEDIKYLNAAFSLIQSSKVNQFTYEFKNTELRLIEPLSQRVLNKKFNWIFYLSSNPIPQEILQQVEQGTYLFVDAKMAQSTESAPFVFDQGFENTYLLEPYQATKIAKPELNLDSVITDKIINRGMTLWSTSSLYQGQAQKVLEAFPYYSGKIFAFYSRFNPSWNSLVTQLQYPHVLLSLLLDTTLLNQHDKPYSIKQYQWLQGLTNEQIESQFESNNHVIAEPSKTHPFKNPIISKILLFLIVLFWAIERILSETGKAKIGKVKTTAVKKEGDRESTHVSAEQVEKN